MSLSSVRQNGRKDHLSSELPPKVMTALALAAGGMTFENAAAEVDIEFRCSEEMEKASCLATIFRNGIN